MDTATDNPDTTDMLSDLAEFDKLSAIRDQMREQMKELEERRSAIESRLTDAFALAGVQNMNVHGATFYRNMRSFVSVKPEHRWDIIEEARKLELDDLITLQPQRFSSWCQEWLDNPKNNKQLPEALRDKVNVYEKISIGIRRG
jgi:hypothetical protein